MLDSHRAARIWWIAKGQLAGSRNPTPQELRVLRSDGFASIICLLDKREQQPSYLPSGATGIGYAWRSIPILDHCAPSIDQMIEFARVVDERLAEGKILVHCWAGWGRTGTMGAAYLISQGLTATTAIASVRRVCPLAIETQEQEASLFALEDALRQESTGHCRQPRGRNGGCD
jgi:atypical dual specificity phosphatase